MKKITPPGAYRWPANRHAAPTVYPPLPGLAIKSTPRSVLSSAVAACALISAHATLAAEPLQAPGEASHQAIALPAISVTGHRDTATTEGHSNVRYQWFRRLYDESPSLQVGGPSTRWVWQGLMAAKQAIQQTRQIKIPLLLIQAGDEKIVSNSAQVKFISKLKKTNSDCQFKLVEGSRHEVLFEQDEYRNQTLDAINQFFA